MKALQGEKVTMIVQQIAAVKAKNAIVVAYDTGKFVLQLPMWHFNLMVFPLHDCSVIDVNATVYRHHDIIPYLVHINSLVAKPWQHNSELERQWHLGS